jgi:homocysteine S-methyltransferase
LSQLLLLQDEKDLEKIMLKINLSILNIKAGEIATNVKKEFPNILIAGGIPPQELTYEADERNEEEIY